VAPLWFTAVIAFVAPLIGYAGVLLGQWMQRRTAREQLAEQQRRDRELWDREDKHRFTEQKRLLYAEYLAAASQFGQFIRKMASEVHLHAEAIGNAGFLDDDEARRQFIIDQRWPEELERHSGNLVNLLSQLDLVAPQSVRTAMDDMQVQLTMAPQFVGTQWNPIACDDHLREAEVRRRNLTEVMRADISGRPVS
jgi:hypothetical protein